MGADIGDFPAGKLGLLLVEIIFNLFGCENINIEMIGLTLDGPIPGEYEKTLDRTMFAQLIFERYLECCGCFARLLQRSSITNASGEQEFAIVLAIDHARSESIARLRLDGKDPGRSDNDVIDLKLIGCQIVYGDKAFAPQTFEKLGNAMVTASVRAQTTKVRTQTKDLESAVGRDKQTEQSPKARIRIVAGDLLNPCDDAYHPESDNDDERRDQALVKKAIVFVAD